MLLQKVMTPRISKSWWAGIEGWWKWERQFFHSVLILLSKHHSNSRFIRQPITHTIPLPHSFIFPLVSFSLSLFLPSGLFPSPPISLSLSLSLFIHSNCLIFLLFFSARFPHLLVFLIFQISFSSLKESGSQTRSTEIADHFKLKNWGKPPTTWTITCSLV